MVILYGIVAIIGSGADFMTDYSKVIADAILTYHLMIFWVIKIGVILHDMMKLLTSNTCMKFI